MKRWTLLDLILAVIALGLICVFLIPVVGTRPRISSNEAATRAQLANYATALQMFHGEYATFPEVFDESGQFIVHDHATSTQFIEMLSGRNIDGGQVAKWGNRRAIAFHLFSNSELTEPDAVGRRQVADRLGNTQFVFLVDHDIDGIIKVPDEDQSKQIRAGATVYSVDAEGEIAVKLW